MRMLRVTWTKTFSILTFGYIFSGLALSGLPGWSRLIYLFSALLVCATAMRLSLTKARSGRWLFLPGIFVTIAIFCGAMRYPDSHDEIVRLIGAWSGGVLAVDAIRRGVSMRIIIYAMLLASVVNAFAVLIGFDAYNAYIGNGGRMDYSAAEARSSGLVGNANLFALQAVLPLFLMQIWTSDIRRSFIYVGIILAIFAVVVSGSRNALLLMIILAAQLWVRSSPKWRVASASLIALALIIFVTWIAVDGASSELEAYVRQVHVVDRIFEGIYGVDRSVALRTWMADDAIRLFWKSPIFGHGLGYFADEAGYGAYAHSNYLEILVSGGFILFGAYYLMHAWVLTRFVSGAMKRGGLSQVSACVAVAGLIGIDFGLVGYDRVIVVLILSLLVMKAYQESSGARQHRLYLTSGY